MLGIYEASFKKISFETGVSIEQVKKAFESFERLSKVKYVKNYVIMVNFMKHQNFNTNMMKSAIDIYNDLPNELKDSNIIVDKLNPSESFETLSKHFGMVRKVEVEYEVEYEYKLEVEKEQKKVSVKNHLFKDSEFYNFDLFEAQFKNTDYEQADLRYYYEAVKNWSASKGEKRLDWVATARNFMLKDVQQNKLILKNGRTNQQTDLHEKYKAQHERAAEAFRRGE